MSLLFRIEEQDDGKLALKSVDDYPGYVLFRLSPDLRAYVCISTAASPSDAAGYKGSVEVDAQSAVEACEGDEEVSFLLRQSVNGFYAVGEEIARVAKADDEWIFEAMLGVVAFGMTIRDGAGRKGKRDWR